jgi:hypothetical protein
VNAIFPGTIELFRRYKEYMTNANRPVCDLNLVNEAEERLYQLDWLVTQIKTREKEMDQFRKKSGSALEDHVKAHLAAGGSPETLPPMPKETQQERVQCQHFIDTMGETQLLTEAFYYFAFRLRQVVRRLPGLQSFEAVGVRDVRNKLLEHPDDQEDSGVTVRSFGFGGPSGPRVKVIRDASQENVFPDNGLYVNAEELREQLEISLSRALAAVPD